MLKELLMLFYFFTKEKKYGNHLLIKEEIHKKQSKSEIVHRYGLPLIDFNNVFVYLIYIKSEGLFFDEIIDPILIRLEFNEDDELIKVEKIVQKSYQANNKATNAPKIVEKSIMQEIFGTIGRINLGKNI